MAAKSSGDDPVDLGPFLQNFVMKNPFIVQQQSSLDGRGAWDRWTPRWRGSWPRLSAALKARRRVDKVGVVNGVHSDNSVSSEQSQSVDLLPHIDDTSAQRDVTAWYVDCDHNHSQGDSLGGVGKERKKGRVSTGVCSR